MLDCPVTVPPTVVGGAIRYALIKIAGMEVGGKSIGRHVGDFMLSGGGNSGEMAAETFAQNMSNHMAEQAENTRPSLDKPESFTGAKPQEVRDAIPESWGEGRPTRDGTGTRWANPDKLGEGVRIMPGTAGAKDPTHAGPTLYSRKTENKSASHRKVTLLSTRKRSDKGPNYNAKTGRR